jgi:UV DNA damage endonuclease
MRVGYPCMNLLLRSISDNKIRCNRTARKKSIEKYGVNYVSDKCEKNLINLFKILRWNVQNDIHFYRITSNLIPWMSKHNIKNLENSDKIYNLLEKIGEFIKSNNLRVSFHPDHFVKLASNKSKTVENSRTELEYHGKVLDIMGLDKSKFYPINIHIGATYDDKEETAKRLEENYKKLSKSVRKRLVLENDDKESCWSISDLVRFSNSIGTPIVLDTLHHKFSGKISHQEAFELARKTWNVKPVIHHSNSKQEYEKSDNPREHSDWIHTKVSINGDYDVMLEAGKKEQALLKYRYNFL